MLHEIFIVDPNNPISISICCPIPLWHYVWKAILAMNKPAAEWTANTQWIERKKNKIQITQKRMKTKMHTNNRREEMMIVFCLRRTRNEHINIQLNRHWKKRHSILMANHELHRHSHGFKWPRLSLNIEYNFNCGNPRTRHTTENGNFMQFVVSIL